MSYLVGLCCALLSFTSPHFAEDYKTYCNEGFSFCIKYPQLFTMVQEAENGDGAVFLSPDKQTEIRSYGSLAIQDFDRLEQEFIASTNNINVSYKVKNKEWFVFSGTNESGEIVYQKTVKKVINYLGDDGTAIFQTLRIVYPASANEKYKAYCKQIAKSL